MIKSKTYNIVGNQIQASELAYTTIYVVKKDGIQQDLYGSDPNRSYIYTQSTGTITFSTEGEKAFVIYKETSPVVDPIPGICEPVGIILTPMPVGIVGMPYEYTLLITGSQPRTLSNIVKPDWAEVYPYGLNHLYVKVSGTPDTETTETVSFDISNGCGTDSFNESFNVVSGTVNLFIGGRFLTAMIQSIDGPDYVLTSGSLPAITNAEGIHDVYTGTISVVVGRIIFPVTLRLQRNGGLLEDIPVASNGTYVFASQSYLSTDEISIFFT